MPAPSRPIDRGIPGPGLLAHVLVSKYADHLPLYRQAGSTPAKASSWSARRWPTGWVRRGLARSVGQGARDAMCSAARQAARRRHAGAGAAAGARHDQDGSAVDLRARRSTGGQTPRHRRCGSGTRPIARACDPSSTLKSFTRHPAGRRLRRLRPALRAPAGSPRRRAGRMCGASSTTCTRRRRRRWRPRRCTRIGALYAIEAEIRGRPPDERRADPPGARRTTAGRAARLAARAR